MLLWTATFLSAQILYLGATQTPGRYIAERESQGISTRPVVKSVLKWHVGLLVAFVAVCVPLVPVLTDHVFGETWLTVAFIAAVAAYAPEFFRRGLFNGRRQPKLYGAQILTETASRLALTAALLVLGAGLFGAAFAIVAAPLVGALAVRSPGKEEADSEARLFSLISTFGFAAPVLMSVAFAQLLLNGGVISLRLLGASPAEVGVFGAAMLLTRIPQYVLSPAVGALLPHASRTLSTEGISGLDRFARITLVVLFLVGVAMVAGAYFAGGFALRLFAGADFEASVVLLTALAALAALYLLAEAVSQMLFALGRGRLAALGWLVGLLVSGAALLVPVPLPVAERVAVALCAGAAAAAVAGVVFYLKYRRAAT